MTNDKDKNIKDYKKKTTSFEDYDNPVIKKYLTAEEIDYVKSSFVLDYDPKTKALLDKINWQEVADYEIAEKDKNKDIPKK